MIMIMMIMMMFTPIPPLCATNESVKITSDVPPVMEEGWLSVASAYKTREPAGLSTTGAAKERRQRLINCRK